MKDGLDKERYALRYRQGVGARYDAENAPAHALDWARRGTAYFARLLNTLADTELDRPSGIPGFCRRDVIAHIGYHGRVLSEIVAWARAGTGDPMPAFAFLDETELRRRASQPAYALRNLFTHSSVHLNVEWRDLNATQWDMIISDSTGNALAVRDTPLLRAKAIWRHSIALNAGGRDEDIPQGLFAFFGRTTPSQHPTHME